MRCHLLKHSRFLSAALVVLFVAAPSVGLARNEKVRVTVGQSITYTLPRTIKTVSIADSDVADVVVAGTREVLINGKRVGLTTLVIWDEASQSTLLDVVVRGPFSDQQIELRVKIAEVNRTKALELGFDFFAMYEKDGKAWAGGLFGGNTATPEIPLSIFGGNPVEDIQGAFRYLTGTTDVQAMIRAAVTDGVLHVLAEPTVVAASGQQADFLSGGEIPVPIASAGVQGGSTVTIEWKEFGVSVSFVPTIVDSGVISLQLAPAVSSLDYTNGLELSGFRIPALRTRRAQTTVELKDGETLVIGGLLLEEETKVRRRIPILGHIPILGYLFSDTENVTNQSELMLVVSPHIVRALPPGSQVQLPDPEAGGSK